MYKGIDVSVLQGIINWQSIADAGYSFMLSRCGIGNSGSDTKCQTNLIGAQNVGLKIGVYHFAYPLPTASTPSRDPKAQAQAHYKAAGDVKVVASDLEWPATTDWQKWECSANQICDWELIYLQEYERISGVRPLIYTYPNFAQNIKLPPNFGTDYKLWIASYVATPTIPLPWHDWIMWQSSGGTEKLPNGVPVDIDYVKDLSMWDSTPASSPQPDPDPTPMNEIAQAPIEIVQPPPSAPPAVPDQGNIISSIVQFAAGLFKR
jgi:lysozyme